MEIFTQEGGIMLSRWGHYLAGVTWIGLLYYFNFVQVPSFAAFEAGPRTEAVRKLVPRALWYFRWGAVLTLLTGLMVLGFQEQFDADYFKTPMGVSIASGILLAVFMFGNVWMIIWPNQRRFIANAEATAAGKEADPAAASWGRKALCASRTNTLFSIPMLFFMGATSHFSVAFLNVNGEADNPMLYLLGVLIVAVVFEAVALTAPAAGAAQAWHLDSHRNTIIVGFAVAIAMILAMEVLL